MDLGLLALCWTFPLAAHPNPPQASKEAAAAMEEALLAQSDADREKAEAEAAARELGEQQARLQAATLNLEQEMSEAFDAQVRLTFQNVLCDSFNMCRVVLVKCAVWFFQLVLCGEALSIERRQMYAVAGTHGER